MKNIGPNDKRPHMRTLYLSAKEKAGEATPEEIQELRDLEKDRLSEVFSKIGGGAESQLSEVFKNVGQVMLSLNDQIKEILEAIDLFYEKYPEMKDIELEDLVEKLGMTEDELDQFELYQVVELLQAKMESEKYQSVIPDSQMIPLAKLYQKLYDGRSIKPVKKGHTGLIEIEGEGTIVQLLYDELDGISYSRPLTPNQKALSDVILTLYAKQPDKPFTIPQVYRLMTGQVGTSAMPTKKKEKEIRADILQGMTMLLRYDSGREKEKYNRKHPANYIISMTRAMYPLAEVEAIINGQRTTAYRFDSEPPLHHYIVARKQLTWIPNNLLRMPEGFRAANRNINIRNYMINRITHIKRSSVRDRNKRGWNKMLFNSILEGSGVFSEGLTNRQRTKLRSTTLPFIQATLKYWIEKGFIKEYAEEVKGNSVRGFVIKV